MGLQPRAWRTPWGVHAPATAGVAAERDLALVGWSADTHDWRGDRAADMHAGVAPLLGAGAIVLMHDGVGPGALRDGCGETVALTRMLLRTLHGNGLATSTASELAR